ncbi:hypothetical protein [Nonomuraea sp. NPDC050786]|uniref:hypothetical protein n=1 Tax=Nonomuraea sp. NPDC050786 TaxID=3154840 RepID=UPI00340D73CB
MAKWELKSYDGGVIPIGGSAVLDSNYPVTVLEFTPPMEDDDDGSVRVQYSWGSGETIKPQRINAYFAD